MSEHVELLTKLASLTMLVFMVSNMLAFGMRLSPAEILAPLREVRHNLKVFLANFVIVPALAYALLHAFHIEGGLAIGLMLLATASGSTCTPGSRGGRTIGMKKTDTICSAIMPASV